MPANVHRLPVRSERRALSPYVRETPELDELVGTRSAVLVHEEALAKQGNAVVGNVFASVQEVFFDVTGRIVSQNAGALNEEHAQLVSGFLHSSVRELQNALVS